MSGPTTDQTRSFFERYAEAFARYHTVALADLFAFLLRVISIAELPTAISVPTRDEWLPVLDGLLGSYRRLGWPAGCQWNLKSAS